jgi:hypothetical protein
LAQHYAAKLSPDQGSKKAARSYALAVRQIDINQKEYPTMGNPTASPAANNANRSELRLSRTDLPLMIRLDDKAYVLVLTKGDKLLLQKPLFDEGAAEGTGQTP